MTAKELEKINEINEHIASYMCTAHYPKTKHEDYYGGFKEWKLFDDEYYETENLKFNSSWDWIMPAWIKLTNSILEDNKHKIQLVYQQMLETNWHKMAKQGLITGEILLVWEAIYLGIQWQEKLI